MELSLLVLQLVDLHTSNTVISSKKNSIDQKVTIVSPNRSPTALLGNKCTSHGTACLRKSTPCITDSNPTSYLVNWTKQKKFSFPEQKPWTANKFPDSMYLTPCTVMKEVKFLSKQHSLKKTPSRSKELLSLWIVAGSQLSIETRKADLMKSTHVSSLKLLACGVKARMCTTIKCPITQTTTNGTTFHWRISASSGNYPTTMRPSSIISKLLTSATEVKDKLKDQLLLTSLTKLLKATTTGHGMRRRTKWCSEALDQLVQFLLQLQLHPSSSELPEYII